MTAGACRERNRAAERIAKDSQQIQDFDNSLTFNDLTLEGFDKQGKRRWKVKSKQASYSKDKKTARIQQPAGELYQDGKAIVQVRAQSGEVKQDGENVFLRGQILAKDLRNGLILQGNELEWQPRNDLLIVRNNATALYQETRVSANTGQYFTRKKRLELKDRVVANSKKPDVQFRSDQVVWLVDQKKLISDRPLQIDRSLPGKPAPDRATSAAGEVNLGTKIATLKQNTQITLSDPPVQVSSNSLVWNLATRTIVSDQPVTLVNQKQRVTLTGDRGQVNTQTQIANLDGNVRGIGTRNQSQLSSDHLTYNLGTQQFLAEGGVNYRQANPPFNLVGPRATGKVGDQTVLVNGGRVRTEFIPDSVIR
ncbi:LPS export ABC transporter periplasmic protein LptC [Kovacikia minuta CCNUW1]|uniref:LPS export ABC transporter periplasmic protein LptC n=1 Tax=Kovacikia minuta TaxID=2931930 RepID=UPI001CCCC0B2|nr:LPS export ABC transporter periplasmic protein LptC [Kovacikia minuta]UBF29722.1 LPS export ABC transporter periplasmic protein LptC [Kovacikia minuta CCNUW1]